MANGPTRVLLADDHAMFRQGLTSILESRADMEVVGQAPNDDGALVLARERRPDVVVMEVRAPFEKARRSLSEMLGISPRPKVVVTTVLRSSRYARELTRLGASAYLLKTSPVEHLVDAIRAAVLDGGGGDVAVGMSRGSRERAEGWREGPLTEREAEVLILVARGLSDRQAASRLYLSESTVKRHLANAYAKMGVGSRTEAAGMALAEGWIPIRDVTETDGGR